jgi:hypothetical protein
VAVGLWIVELHDHRHLLCLPAEDERLARVFDVVGLIEVSGVDELAEPEFSRSVPRGGLLRAEDDERTDRLAAQGAERFADLLRRLGE